LQNFCLQLSDVAELSVMMGIVVGSIILSPFLGYQPRSGDVYSEEACLKVMGMKHQKILEHTVSKATLHD
jgi:hypothetical protein